MKAARPVLALTALLASLAALSPAAAATTYRVDDTGTVVNQPVTPMRWRQFVPGRAGDNTVEGNVTVSLRLNLAAWLNRQARIYMSLAPTDGEQMVATWRTQGRLLPGTVRGGGRTLVFEGVVRDQFLEENILLNLTANGRAVERPQSLQFFFEIEVSP